MSSLVVMAGRIRAGCRVSLIAVAAICLSLWGTAMADPVADADPARKPPVWEMPGRLSIYDLQFGPAVLKDNQWQFLGNMRVFDVRRYGDRLTLMIRFSYQGSRDQIPLKFLIRLPESRQHEETVYLRNRTGKYVYKFTIHNPEEFLGTGSIYLYYGFSIVDVLDFTISPGT